MFIAVFEYMGVLLLSGICMSGFSQWALYFALLWLWLIYRFWCLRRIAGYGEVNGNPFVVDVYGQVQGSVSPVSKGRSYRLIRWRIFDQSFLVLFVRL